LREHLEQWLRDDSLPLSMRAGALNEVLRDVLSESFAEGKADPIVAVARAMGAHAVQLLASVPVTFGDFIRVLYHDYATFTHSANVCYYSVLLASALGMKERELMEIAVGGLLHDLGKLQIDSRILLKEGSLEERERRQIRKHPSSGFQQLCRRDDISQGQLMMVYQHHERIDGRGYPVGVAGEEIHPWARLCTVADVFEALTSNRPYRRALSLEGALQIMTKTSGQAFDPEMLKCWTKIVLHHSQS
jgi:HD-GYP domain-containing protein (c-di-GMP phosphodiesterase class II)